MKKHCVLATLWTAAAFSENWSISRWRAAKEVVSTFRIKPP